MENLIALTALASMEIILGIDNVVLIAILTGRLPEAQREKARVVGLLAALGMRLALLFALGWIMGMEAPCFSWTDLGVPESWVAVGEDGHAAAHHGEGDAEARNTFNEVSLKDIVLFIGGLFLIGKSIHEIHKLIEHDEDHQGGAKHVSFASVITQIVLFDLVFSLDSVITAVGMADQIWVMVTAMIIAVAVMLLFSKSISDFVLAHPTLKVLALSFLILIGVMLTVEGLGGHMNKGYIYFAMAFALALEVLNMRIRKNKQLKTKTA